jgi:chromosome segregation ATPase
LRKLEDTQETVDLFRSQVIKASSSLRKFEDVNGTATDAIMAAQKETQQVKKELSKATSHSLLLLEDLNSTKSKLAEVEEQAASTAKALENAELELDILENEDRNDRQALEKLSKSTAAADGLAARGQAEVNQMVSTLRGQQKSASRTEQKAIDERTRAVEEQERYTNLQSQLQGKYEQNKRQLDEANQEVQRLLAENKTIRDQDKENSTATIHPAQDELSQAKRELAEAVQVTQRVLAENQVLREQAKEIPASSPNQAVQQQRDNAMLEIREELSQAKSELSRVNEGTQRLMAETKTLREQSETNSAVMLNQAPPNRPPNEQLVFQEKSFHAQQMNTLHYHIEHLKALQIELNRANLQNFTMQRAINNLKTIIANGAAGGLTAPSF